MTVSHLSCVRRVITISERAGVSPQELIVKGGLEESAEVLSFADFSKPERKHWASLERVYSVWDAAIEAQQDERFMLDLVASLDAAGLGTLGFLMLTSATLAESMNHFTRGFELVTNSGRWEQRLASTQVTFVWHRLARTPGQCAANESMFAHLTHILADVAGHPIRPERVSFQHPPLCTRGALELLLNCPIEYGASENGLTLPREALDARPRLSDAAVARYFSQCVGQGLELVRSSYGVVDALRLELRRCASLGGESVLETSERLGLSVRTLQRRLDEAGTSFSAELEKARRERAFRLITGTSRSLAEIARELGFTEASAFSRAFRRWYATPPSALRKSGAPRSVLARRGD